VSAPSYTALVEVPRGSVIKRELHAGGSIDYISPWPCPFNYGCIPDRMAADGDPADAIILGPRLALGARVRRPAVALVRFLDAGEQDDKLVLSDRPLSRRDRLALVAFFRFYERAKRLLNRLRGQRGRTAFLGVEETGYSTT